MKKKNKVKALLVIMLLLIALLSYMVSRSYSKYVTQVRGTVFAEIQDRVIENNIIKMEKLN